MAVISANMRLYLDKIRRDPAAWTEIKSLSPSKGQLHDLIQGLEDFFEANRAGMKTAMETSAGISISNTLAKKIGKVWMETKWGGE